MASQLMALTYEFDMMRGIKFQTYCEMNLLLALRWIKPMNLMLDPLATYTCIINLAGPIICLVLASHLGCNIAYKEL